MFFPNFALSIIRKTMTKNKCNLLLLALLCLSMGLNAQQQYIITKSDYHGTGEDISSVNSSEEYFLYNVGQDLFLNAGSYWGTEAVVFTVGLPVKIVKDVSTATYTITGPFSGAYGNKLEYTNADSGAGFYWDRNDGKKWTFERVNGFSSNDKEITGTEFVYKMKNNGEYMYSFNPLLDGNFWGNPMNAVRNTPPENSSLTEEQKTRSQYWKIVKRSTIENDFEKTYDNLLQPTDASFLIRAQNFNRHNIYSIGQSSAAWQSSDGISYENSAQCAEFGSSTSNSTSGLTSQEGKYGMFYVCRITKGNEGGTVSQTFTVPKAGWYRLDCEGFYHNNTNTDTRLGELYAVVDGAKRPADGSSTSKYAYVEFVSKESKETPGTAGSNGNDGSITSMSEAGMAFFYKYYPTSVMFYAAAGKEVEIGVRLTQKLSSGDYVCFDDFELKFLGDELVLNENDTVINPHKDDNDYLRRTLLFVRKFTLGKWNTIMLPFDMTKQQFVSAFKSDARVAELNGIVSSSTIQFLEKDIESMNDTDVLLEKGKGYIMLTNYKGKVEKYQTSEAYEKRIIDYYYPVERVSLNKTTLSSEGADEIQYGTEYVAPAPDDPDDPCKIRMAGTYVQRQAPANSYVFSGGDMYHLKTDKDIKGYRCWIEDAHQMSTGTQGKRHPLTVSMNGVSDDATEIIGLFGDCDYTPKADNNIYSLSGQVVGTCSDGTTGLPKGIYIVKGRKCLVR